MILFSEVIKLENGYFYQFEYHQDRVNRTAEIFYGTSIDISGIKDALTGKESGLYKCRILYGQRIENVEYTPYTIRSIQKVGVIKADYIDYSYKYADRSALNSLLAESACDEILIIKNGLLTDASSSNLVLQSAQEWVTPKDCLLEGTQRRYLLEKHLIREKKIPIEELKKYHTVHFINAMMDINAQVKIDTDSLIYLF